MLGVSKGYDEDGDDEEDAEDDEDRDENTLVAMMVLMLVLTCMLSIAGAEGGDRYTVYSSWKANAIITTMVLL